MCKRLSYEEILINNEQTLYKCDGIVLMNVFEVIAREIDSYKKDGAKFTMTYNYRSYYGTYESGRTLVDDADLNNVFNTSKSIDSEHFVNNIFMEDLRMLFLAMYRDAIYLTTFTFRFNSENGRHSKFEWTFDVPISYAWDAISHGRNDEMFTDCMHIVREYWQYALTKNYLHKYCYKNRYKGD